MIPSKVSSPPSNTLMVSHTPLMTGATRYSYSPIIRSISIIMGRVISDAVTPAAFWFRTMARRAAASLGMLRLDLMYFVLTAAPMSMISTSVLSSRRMISYRLTVMRTCLGLSARDV